VTPSASKGTLQTILQCPEAREPNG